MLFNTHADTGPSMSLKGLHLLWALIGVSVEVWSTEAGEWLHCSAWDGKRGLRGWSMHGEERTFWEQRCLIQICYPPLPNIDQNLQWKSTLTTNARKNLLDCGRLMSSGLILVKDKNKGYIWGSCHWVSWNSLLWLYIPALNQATLRVCFFDWSCVR